MAKMTPSGSALERRVWARKATEAGCCTAETSHRNFFGVFLQCSRHIRKVTCGLGTAPLERSGDP